MEKKKIILIVILFVIALVLGGLLISKKTNNSNKEIIQSNNRDESLEQLEVTNDTINIRVDADTKSDKIGKVLKGEIYTIIETKEDNYYTWYKIKITYRLLYSNISDLSNLLISDKKIKRLYNDQIKSL